MKGLSIQMTKVRHFPELGFPEKKMDNVDKKEDKVYLA